MTNRDKYKFDYFTLENYKKFIEIAYRYGITHDANWTKEVLSPKKHIHSMSEITQSELSNLRMTDTREEA